LEFEEVLERDKECEKELTAHTLTLISPLISPTTPSIKSFPDYLTQLPKETRRGRKKTKTKNQ
jgi:hypothetical protein